ncbi:MAG: DUF4494 domain-containing protein [Prevotella sp.]|nr:DUF4494 domain-containing protein [Prevotella sp.]
MKSRTSKWFETSVRYERQGDEGLMKKVNELYVVEALTFGEAEVMITQEISSYVSGEFEVKNITPTSYGEIFFSENTNDDRWYKARLSFITIDEKTEKEKRTSVYYLVQASTFNGAVKNIEDVMSGTMIDYVISNITETKIMDVYTHDEIIKSNATDDKPEYEQ